MNWTNNPYVDIGLATILAFCDKDEPEELTEADLSKVALWIAENYSRDPLKSFLTVAFTSNAWFAQPSFTPEKRAERGKVHLFAWQSPDAEGERCVFMDLPVSSAALSDKLMAGRAARAQIPLAMGDEGINFYPNGDAGLPVSGEALLCLQAFPLGCAKVQGRLLAAHSSDPELTKAFARKFWLANQLGVQVAQAAGSTKLRETPFTLGTALAHGLMDILNDHKAGMTEFASLTAYHLTNGQSPEIAIYHLPLGVMRFLRRANGGSYQSLWQRLVQSAWQSDEPKAPKAKKAAAPAEAASAKADKPRKNYLYEDLLKLPDNAPHFLRVYFLRKAARYARQNDQDPRGEYSTSRQASLVSWDLTQLFLTEVMNMDKTRIEHIRQVGDTLANYVRAENDRKFFSAFFGETKYEYFRKRLIKASTEWVKHGHPPLISFDQFMEVFEEGDEIGRKDWPLARDLVLIRMIEQLHVNGWLARNQDALPEETPEDNQKETNEK